MPKDHDVFDDELSEETPVPLPEASLEAAHRVFQRSFHAVTHIEDLAAQRTELRNAVDDGLLAEAVMRFNRGVYLPTAINRNPVTSEWLDALGGQKVQNHTWIFTRVLVRDNRGDIEVYLRTNDDDPDTLLTYNPVRSQLLGLLLAFHYPVRPLVQPHDG